MGAKKRHPADKHVRRVPIKRDKKSKKTRGAKVKGNRSDAWAAQRDRERKNWGGEKRRDHRGLDHVFQGHKIDAKDSAKTQVESHQLKKRTVSGGECSVRAEARGN